MIDLKQRYLGSILGLACGDAIGGPVEFYRRGRFPEVTGMHGGGKFQLQPGEWTDDTAMALCLAESLLECGGVDPLDQMQRYWRWANDGRHSTRPHAFGLGKTVAAALGRFRRTGQPLAGSSAPNSAGNGSLMRLAPIALYFHSRPGELLAAAELSSRTTHAAETCLASCRYLVAALHAALAGAPDKDAVLAWASTLDLPDEMLRIRERRFQDADIATISGSGYVVDSLEAALWCFWTTESLEAAVLQAANLGDDADTTAAICGQLAGAFYGAGAIPAPWLEALHYQDVLRSMAERLFEAVVVARNS
ncbi:ADP-ribosylglycohydrolase family protein [Luteimonas sp. MHLX1A]|uniref:ADP-ribosylglycohydrolase family protein n=1 Tax=Alterluteimonas muca TaxID=2878684 RepID=UPI00210646A8|nr:ADP-ribosylglycohydrolase family protein [Luteimonas sp. MHLX1A]